MWSTAGSVLATLPARKWSTVGQLRWPSVGMVVTCLCHLSLPRFCSLSQNYRTECPDLCFCGDEQEFRGACKTTHSVVKKPVLRMCLLHELTHFLIILFGPQWTRFGLSITFPTSFPGHLGVQDIHIYPICASFFGTPFLI